MFASGSAQVKAESHQQQLERLKDEVEALRQQLRRAQRLATVGTMTAMVAHEFNNILTPIINYAQLAQSNPALTGKAIAKAADGGKRASHICKAILGMSRDGQAKPEQANMAELIDQTLAAMAREPHKDGIELTLSAPSDLTIQTRRVEFQQVLLNLLINARTAVLAKPAPRTIEIRAAGKGGEHIVLEVSDNGVGIAPENLQKIFQPFFTTKRTDEDGSTGHGLGLAICKDIVTALGGQITVSSTPNKGTTFRVLLPQ